MWLSTVCELAFLVVLYWLANASEHTLATQLLHTEVCHGGSCIKKVLEPVESLSIPVAASLGPRKGMVCVQTSGKTGMIARINDIMEVSWVSYQ